MRTGATVRLPRLPLVGGKSAWTPRELAGRVRVVAASPSGMPKRLLDVLGWEYRESPLMADVGGQDALLLPLSAGGFRVVVDPRVSQRQYWCVVGRPNRALLTSTIAFRTAHEIGHTFFYDPGCPPSRRLAASSEEEVFCDLFAAALIVPDVERPTASRVVEVARRLGGNLELAALWAASLPGVTVDVRAPRRHDRFGGLRRRGPVTSVSLGDTTIEVAAA